MPLTLDDQHRYWLDGRRLAGVTSVLGGCGILPDYEFVDEWYLHRGTLAHQAIELDIHGKLDESTLDPELEPFVRRARRFREMFELEVSSTERSAADEVWGYAGTWDAIGWSPVQKQDLLVDWKTGPYHRGHEIQVGGAYAPLADLCEVRTVHACVIVPLDSDNARPVFFESTDFHRAVFRGALQVHAWKNHKGGS